MMKKTNKLTGIFLALLVALLPWCSAYASATQPIADGYMGAAGAPPTGRSVAEMQQALEDVSSLLEETIGGHAEHSVTTLASDSFTPVVDYSVYSLLPETGTADNLATINATGVRDGGCIVIRNNNATNTITVKEGSGNIHLADATDYALNNTGDYICFIYRASAWYELYRVSANQIKVLPGGRAETSITLDASNGLTPTQAQVKVDTNGGAGTQNFDQIASTFTGNLLIVRATNTSHVPTIRDNQTPAAGFYTIRTADGGSISLTSLGQYVILHKDVTGTAWREVIRGGFGLPSNVTITEQCRAYLATGAPATGNSINVTSNFYVGPYNGHTVTLPDSTGNIFTALPLSEITTALPSQVYRMMDVFIQNTAGAVAVATQFWDSGGQTSGTITGVSIADPPVITAANSLSAGDVVGIANIVGTVGTTAKNGLNGRVFRVASATGANFTLSAGEGATTGLAYTSGGNFYKIPSARTTGLTFQNGLYLNSGNLAQVYIATILVGDQGVSAQTQDWLGARLVWNYFNRLPLQCDQYYNGTSSHTYSTAAIRAFDQSTALGVNGSASNGARSEFVVGIAEDVFSITSTQKFQSSAVGNGTFGGWVDSSVTTNLQFGGNVYGSVAAQPFSATYTNFYKPAIGYHYLQAYEAFNAGTAGTWFSAGNGSSQVNADQSNLILGRW